MVLENILFGQCIPYQSSWLQNTGALKIGTIPQNKLSLGRFPTPLQHISLDSTDYSTYGIDFWIKRDDLSSFDLSGNKVRKLEFLLEEAIRLGHDSVITIGGVQSNHARATAVAARQLGLEPYLILRKTTNDQKEETMSVTGNLLLDRMVDAKIFTVTPGNYARIGSDNLVQHLGDQLKLNGKNPYLIPVGGSNTLGAFGYMECAKEIVDTSPVEFDHIVFASGSGGTVAGLAIGMKLLGFKGKLHAVGVCDSPEYFYNHIKEVALDLKIDFSKYGEVESWVTLYNGQGIGYAKSTKEELEFLVQFSQKTGVVFDPVYSGKALIYLMKNLIKDNTIISAGQRVLFIHTGGTLGFYDKVDQLDPLLPSIQKLDLSPIIENL